MELRQLEYFITVSRLKNLTRAAEQVYVTQPTITMAIQKLEEELGVSLFDRSKKNFSLTAEGEIFLQRVDATLQGLKDAVAEIQDYVNLQKGTIKLGLPPMLGTYFLPPILIDFQKRFPAIEIATVEAGGSMRTRELVKAGEIDVGIVVISECEPQLDTIPLAKGEIAVCLAKEHPLSRRPVLSLEQLRDEPLVVIPEGSYVHRTIVAEFKRRRIVPHIAFSSAQAETVLCLVRKGVGITFLIDFLARQYPDIVIRPLASRLPIEVGLTWKKDKYPSRACLAFIEFMTEFSLAHREGGTGN